MSSPAEFIVVGVDGSDAAMEAVRWAAREAVYRQCELRMVTAFTLPAMAGYREFTSYPADFEEGMRRDSERTLDRIARELHVEHPNLRIVTKVSYRRTLDTIRSESVGAVLTVVGSGDQSRLPGVVLGSVAMAVASTNPAPVAVIHTGQLSSTQGPVLLGVDGTATSEAAIAFAFTAAATRGAELLAVHVWHDVIVPGSRHLHNPLLDPARIEQGERTLLSERLAGWADKYPEVSVRQSLVRGRAVPELLERARHAQLVVVGSHGHGGFTGMLLGSTSHALIIHSAAPVVVVRQPAAH